MNDDDCFLRAIQIDPEDQTLRLAYADWLEERGDQRAGYIRLRYRHAQIVERLNDATSQMDSEWLARVGWKQKRSHFYELPPVLTLQSGRPLRLQELRQRETYWGLMEGLP